MIKHVYFMGEKYFLKEGRYFRTVHPQIKLSHAIWNHYNPNDKIQSKDGYMIHHKDEDKSNDKIENLQKVTRKEHAKLHPRSDKTKEKMSRLHSGNGNPMYGKKDKESPRYRVSHTVESKNKIRNSHIGMQHLMETKLKMRISHRFRFIISNLNLIDATVGEIKNNEEIR